MRAIGHRGYYGVAEDRDAVTKVFTSREVKKAIKKLGIRLIGYADLKKTRPALERHYKSAGALSPANCRLSLGVRRGGPEDWIHTLILRQSFIKQQSVYGHSPLDVPKHGVHPSATWTAWISSGFFFLPGIIPRALAFSFTSGIVIRLSPILIVCIRYLLSVLTVAGPPQAELIANSRIL